MEDNNSFSAMEVLEEYFNNIEGTTMVDSSVEYILDKQAQIEG